jgi:hypothetical protein
MVLTEFAEERFMRYNSDPVAPHSAIIGIMIIGKLQGGVKFAAERHIPGSLY